MIDSPPPPADDRPALRGMSEQAMHELLAGAGFEAYRARQLYQWVFRKAAGSLDEMTNLPKKMREWLAANTRIGGVEIIRAQGDPAITQKILFKTDDGRFIEAVVMRDEGVGRTSLCVSSQVGCALGCSFCLTGFGGFQRNLRPDEITGQILAIRREVMPPDELIQHVVFMGMGEPMLNVEGVSRALRLMTDPDGMGLSRRRITVSTAGVVTGIEKFGAAELGVGLAVSLNATTDEVRDRLMPINKKWPIEKLLESLRKFPMEARRRITIEYVLLRGENDSPDDARRLVRLLKGMQVKVNLIMFNPSAHLPYHAVPEATLDFFARTLSAAHMTVTVRWSKGREVEAACGQLAAHYFEESAQAG